MLCLTNVRKVAFMRVLGFLMYIYQFERYNVTRCTILLLRVDV